MASSCTVQLVVELLHTRVGVPPTMSGIETMTWEELGVESLGLTEVSTGLEQALDMVLPLNDVLQTKNINELVTVVNALGVA